jgi:3-hydroxyacyl-CoA dehydrogenase
MAQLVSLTKQGNVAVIAVNNPPVNALSHPVRVGIRQLLGDALEDTTVEAIVIWCEGRTFIAGADIREFGKVPLDPDLPELVEFVAGARKRVIAAIHGTALGGGLELALACDFRVALANAKLGLPEITLGILPGAGGTQRLPRLVGARAALDMIVGGRPLVATKAQAIGLIDELVEGDLKASALAFAERVISERRPARKIGEQSVLLDEQDLFEEYEQRIAGDSRGLLAPFHAIRAIRAAVELPFAEGLLRERELFRELMESPQSKAQRHVFFAEREAARPPGLSDALPAREVKTAGVVGDGVLGGRIAMCFANARIPVVLLGTTREHLELELSTLEGTYSDAVKTGTLRQAEMDERMALVRPTLSYGDLRAADLVVEAVFYDVALKREVFAALDAACKPGSILASHPPSIDLDEIASRTKRSGDVAGVHFFTPAETVKALEVVRASQTLPEVCATMMKVGKALGKVPVLVSAREGLVSSRTLEQCWHEALSLVAEGAQPEQVDRVFRDFGFPAGPLATPHVAGLGVDRVLRRLESEERSVQRRAIDDQEILERCLYAVINEGARLLEDGSVPRALEVDMVWVHGFGFPSYRGGPMFYADQIGLPVVYEAVCRYRERLGTECWAPAPLLERLAKERRGFYG